MKHLVLLDESSVRNNMTRRYGRARGGSRCCDAVIAGRVLSMTIVSSIRLDGTTESFVFEGALTKTIFEVYVQKILAPSLREGDIVIMDNLSSHKSQVAEEVIRSRKAKVLFLPAYSPDLNPIEKMWSKVKQLLRGIRAKTIEEIYSGINNKLSISLSICDILFLFSALFFLLVNLLLSLNNSFIKSKSIFLPLIFLIALNT